MAKKLFVGNLPWSTTVEELTELFGKHGELSDVFIPRDRETNRPRGFAFIEFVEDEGADAAISDLHEYELNGREIQVNVAQPKRD